MAKYDFLIVGSGLFGAVFAQRAAEAGKKCLVIDRRPHIGGLCYTENLQGIEVHRYGAHIFHTNNRAVWEHISRFAVFNRFTNCPLANYNGELYNLPFNMNTFRQLWGVISPEQARAKIEEQRRPYYTANPRNLEEQALCLAGPEIYEKLIKGYTEKQWGRPCRDLPPGIIKRLPLRFTYDNNYFDAEFQGIPKQGYTALIHNLLEGADLELNADYLQNRAHWDAQAAVTLYTGAVDEFYNYQFGPLEYRSIRFEVETLPVENYQGNAVINYTGGETPYTRIIEHKHFTPQTPISAMPYTVISREYSAERRLGDEPHYPVNNAKNTGLYAKYRALSNSNERVIFGGRLAEYAYLDMDIIVERALKAADDILTGKRG